ncbi:hypothetical protein N2152v2_006965 [Parachlorella kessleri]
MGPDQRKGKGLRKRCRSGIYTDDLSRADLLALANLPSHKAAEKAGLGITGWPSTSTNSSGAEEEEADESDWQEGAGQVPGSGEIQSLLQLPPLPLLLPEQAEQPVQHAAVQQPVRGLLDLLASAAEADSTCSTPQPSGSATEPVMRPRALRVLGPGEASFDRAVLQRNRVPGWRGPVALPSFRSAFVPYTQPTLRLAFTSVLPDLPQPTSPAAAAAAAGALAAGSLTFSYPSDVNRLPSDASRPGGGPFTPLPPVASVLLPPTPAEYTPRLSRAEAPQLLAQQVQQLVLQQAQHQHQQDLARAVPGGGTAAGPAAATTLARLGRQGSNLAAGAAAGQQQQQPPCKGQDELLGQLRQAQAVWRRYKAMAQSLDAARQQAEQAAAAEGALLPATAEGPSGGSGGWGSSLSEQLKHSAAGAVGSWLQSLATTAARGERPASRMPPAPAMDARPTAGYGAAAIPNNSGASMWRNSMTAPSAC